MAIFALAIIVIIAGIVMLISGFKGRQGRLIGLGGLVLGLIIMFATMIVVIDAGEIGVVVIFGTVQEGSLAPGINFVPPYAEIYKYSTRIQTQDQSQASLIEARDEKGLVLKIDCSMRYAINPTMAAEVYAKYATNLGDLNDRILVPTMRAVIRDVMSKYDSEQIYSSKREIIALEVEETLRKELKPKGILIDKFLVRAIDLPETVDAAIQAKITAQQEAAAMEYRQLKAKQEAEIKIIEAKGLAEAQSIINSTLSPAYLQHEAIQNYKELATSPNTTFVIMPTNPNGTGIPLILGGAR
jgi:regulator of protease activity HflC (stomatin/prohibitin superfamily)